MELRNDFVRQNSQCPPLTQYCVPLHLLHPSTIECVLHARDLYIYNVSLANTRMDGKTVAFSQNTMQGPCMVCFLQRNLSSYPPCLAAKELKHTILLYILKQVL